MHDEGWFERLYRAHSRAIHSYFVRRAARDDAPDLAAEVFVVAWRRREDVPDGEMELAWLYRTAGFILANHRRKLVPVPVEDMTLGAAPDDPELAAIDSDRVRAALASLPERDREILLLAAWDGMNGRQLAGVLGVSRGGADAALSRARARLAEAWQAVDRAHE